MIRGLFFAKEIIMHLIHLPLLSKAAGFVANISSNVAFLPQIIKSYRRKQVADISIGMFFILFLTQLCWILYAVPIGAKNLWISSVIEIALLLPLFAMWFMYRPRDINKGLRTKTILQKIRSGSDVSLI